jgi:glutathione-regulated potassium-efflux system ancillary protein KefC
VAGRYALRPLFRFIAGSGLREIFTATALLLVVGIALLMQLIGLSPALGTFLAGVVLANSEYRLALESDIEPFKALLLGLFFISVGMSINFGVLGDHPALIAAIIIGMIALKLVVLVGLAHAFGLRSEQKLLFSFLLAQGGEFAFVLFQFAAAEGAIATEVAKMLVVVVALTMAATPLMMLFLDRTLQPLWSGGGGQREPDKVEPQGHPVIVIGYGRFGQIVGRFLSASGVGMVILDNDPNHVEVLRKFGVRAFYGDATRLDLLEAAGGERARLFVVAIDDQDKAVATVRAIRGHFPHAKVFARARNRDHVYDLWDAGAHFTRRETFDAALVMGREALVALGEHPFAARRRARMFIEHDEGMLAEGFAVRDSDESLVKLSRQAREQLERLVAIDKGATPAEKDHGWGD